MRSNCHPITFAPPVMSTGTANVVASTMIRGPTEIVVAESTDGPESRRSTRPTTHESLRRSMAQLRLRICGTPVKGRLSVGCAVIVLLYRIWGKVKHLG